MKKIPVIAILSVIVGILIVLLPQFSTYLVALFLIVNGVLALKK